MMDFLKTKRISQYLLSTFSREENVVYIKSLMTGLKDMKMIREKWKEKEKKSSNHNNKFNNNN